MPDGAAAIAWVPANNRFEVISTAAWKANHENATSSLTVSNVNKYVYPAALYYYANSGLKTSTSKQSDKYKNYDYWKGVLDGLYGGDYNIFVSNDTRSVAIADSIQYGVALLDTRVKASAAKLTDAAGNSIDVNNLKVTAVLVGNQGPVKYNFSPATLGDFIVYDSIMESPAASLPFATDTYTTPNTTLVLETPEDENVLIAVELLNDAADFVGVGGRIIPKGTKFYLVAELDHQNVTEPELEGKIFKQDYTTVVKLTLTNLNKAYNVIPDLRSSKMEVGFAVDLSWKSGHEFSITF